MKGPREAAVLAVDVSGSGPDPNPPGHLSSPVKFDKRGQRGSHGDVIPRIRSASSSRIAEPGFPCNLTVGGPVLERSSCGAPRADGVREGRLLNLWLLDFGFGFDLYEFKHRLRRHLRSLPFGHRLFHEAAGNICGVPVLLGDGAVAVGAAGLNPFRVDSLSVQIERFLARGDGITAGLRGLKIVEFYLGMVGGERLRLIDGASAARSAKRDHSGLYRQFVRM